MNRSQARALTSALFGGILAATLLTAGASSATSPWEPYTFAYGPQVTEDFCDVPGLDVEQEGEVTAGLNRTKTKGPDGLVYFFDWETYSETWTNLANGRYVTVAGSFRGGAHSVTDNGDGTFTVVVQNTGSEPGLRPGRQPARHECGTVPDHRRLRRRRHARRPLGRLPSVLLEPHVARARLRLLRRRRPGSHLRRRHVQQRQSRARGHRSRALCRPASASRRRRPSPALSLLVSGLQGSFGSTVGPGGDLYVAEGAARRVSRVDPETGTVTTFASGLPAQVVPGAGAASDVAFIDGTAYVLVQFIGPYLGGPDEVNGIYRVDGPDSFTVVADIGAFNVANPPDTDFEAPDRRADLLPGLPRWLPGHRRTPEPDASCHARR